MFNENEKYDIEKIKKEQALLKLKQETFFLKLNKVSKDDNGNKSIDQLTLVANNIIDIFPKLISNDETSPKPIQKQASKLNNQGLITNENNNVKVSINEKDNNKLENENHEQVGDNDNDVIELESDYERGLPEWKGELDHLDVKITKENTMNEKLKVFLKGTFLNNMSSNEKTKKFPLMSKIHSEYLMKQTSLKVESYDLNDLVTSLGDLKNAKELIYVKFEATDFKDKSVYFLTSNAPHKDEDQVVYDIFFEKLLIYNAKLKKFAKIALPNDCSDWLENFYLIPIPKKKRNSTRHKFNSKI